MNPIDKDIRQQHFHRFYLLYGQENYLRRYYRNRLRSAVIPDGGEINLHVYQGKDIDLTALIDQAQTLPFFAPYRLLIIEDSDFFKSAGSLLCDRMESFPEETILLFSQEEPDKKSRLFQFLKNKGCLLECKYLKGEALTNWIIGFLKNNRKMIQRRAMDRFLACTGEDLQGISMELEKLISYVGEREGISEQDVEAVCIPRLEDRVYLLTDAIVSGSRQRAMHLYQDLLNLKEDPVGLLAMLTGQWMRLLQVRDLRDQGFDRNEVIARTGLTDFRAGKAIAQCAGLSASVLEEAVRVCADADARFKSGMQTDQLALELAIVRLLALFRHAKQS